MWVFVDVDGTLIDIEDNPRPYIPEFILKLKKLGCKIIIWSAGGASYAEVKFNAICNKLYWSENSNWNLYPHIQAYLGKGIEEDALNLMKLRFYVDDVQELLDYMAQKGHGTFKVPFYIDPTIADLADKNDRWLLKAADAIEKDLHARCSGSSVAEHGEDSTTASEKSKENSNR